jgi:hypothetical protein
VLLSLCVSLMHNCSLAFTEQPRSQITMENEMDKPNDQAIARTPQHAAQVQSEQVAANSGVADVLRLLDYCTRIQSAFPQLPNIRYSSWITTSSRTT